MEINYNKNMEMLSLAFKYCTEDLSHTDIINELYNDDDLKKQVCLIELSKINNQEEAEILVFNLTGQAGPVREAASFKILELIQKEQFRKFFQNRKILDIFIKSITDINPSISRNACRIIQFCSNQQYIYEKLIEKAGKTIFELEEIRDTASYAANKKNFSLFWILEALSLLSQEVKTDNLQHILEKSAQSKNYTIREKTAAAAKAFRVNTILKMLEKDENIYVRKNLREISA